MNVSKVGPNEEEFKKKYQIGFSKRRVAEKIKQIALREGFDEGSKPNLLKVIDRLADVLKGQISRKEPNSDSG